MQWMNSFVILVSLYIFPNIRPTEDFDGEMSRSFWDKWLFNYMARDNMFLMPWMYLILMMLNGFTPVNLNTLNFAT